MPTAAAGGPATGTDTDGVAARPIPLPAADGPVAAVGGPAGVGAAVAGADRGPGVGPTSLVASGVVLACAPLTGMW